MERLLFLDACVRGPELSRTWRLCQRFLEEYTTLHPQVQVCHRDLRESLPILTGELARQRQPGGVDSHSRQRTHDLQAVPRIQKPCRHRPAGQRPVLHVH